MKAFTRGLLALLVFSFALAARGDSVTLGFNNITNNNAVDAAIGEAQMFVEVTNDGLPANQVAFSFFNIGPAASSITDVYFDDGTLLGIAQILNGPGVQFSLGANPGELPGGNELTPAFQTTAGFLADSDSPVQPRGVNPGESLTSLFSLISGQTYADTIAALVGAEDLRIGIKVQGFDSQGSESFVNNPPAIPLPAAVWGGLALFGGLGASRLRSRFSRD